MNPPFFITGFPRSRTSWLSVFLTTDKSHCLHDGLSGCPGLDEYRAKLFELRPSFTHVGDSSSALVMFYPQLRSHYPAAKWVLVERDHQEAFQACRKSHPDFKNATVIMAFEKTERAFIDLRNSKHVLRVPFNSLNDEETLREIWWHVMPEIRFDERRFGLLDPLQIQPHPKKEHEKFTRFQPQHEQLLKESTWH